MKKTLSDSIFAMPSEVGMKWESALMRLLSAPRTRRDLAVRLRDKGCPEETAQPLLDRFETLGLIDDKAYAVLFVDSKSDWGVLRIRDELRARGVSREHIADALEECEVDEAGRALRLARQWNGVKGMTPQKLDGRLRRRGFSSASIREAFENLRLELEDEDPEESFF